MNNNVKNVVYYVGQNVDVDSAEFPKDEVFLVYEDSYGNVLGFTPDYGDFSFNKDLVEEDLSKCKEISIDKYKELTKGYDTPEIYLNGQELIKNDMLLGFYSYSGFSEPELIAKDLEGFKENVLFREGFLTDSVDVTDKVNNAFEEELDWINEYYGEVNINNADHREHLQDFLYEYGVWVNPTKGELQEFNVSRGLDKNEHIGNVFGNQKEINADVEMEV